MDQKLSGVLKPIKDLPIRDFILLVKFLKKYNQLVPPPSEVDIQNNVIYTINADGSIRSKTILGSETPFSSIVFWSWINTSHLSDKGV